MGDDGKRNGSYGTVKWKSSCSSNSSRKKMHASNEMIVKMVVDGKLTNEFLSSLYYYHHPCLCCDCRRRLPRHHPALCILNASLFINLAFAWGNLTICECHYSHKYALYGTKFTTFHTKNWFAKNTSHSHLFPIKIIFSAEFEINFFKNVISWNSILFKIYFNERTDFF